MARRDATVEVAKLSYQQAVAVALVGGLFAVLTTIASNVLRGNSAAADSPSRDAENIRLRMQVVDLQSKINTGNALTAGLVRQRGEANTDAGLRADLIAMRDNIALLQQENGNLKKQLTAEGEERTRMQAEASAAATALRDLGQQKDAAEAAAITAKNEVAALRRDLRIAQETPRVEITRGASASRPAVYSVFSTADLSVSECTSRAKEITTGLGGSLTKEDGNALFLAHGAYSWGVTCLASSKLISIIIAGPDIAEAARSGDAIRVKFMKIAD